MIIEHGRSMRGLTTSITRHIEYPNEEVEVIHGSSQKAENFSASSWKNLLPKERKMAKTRPISLVRSQKMTMHRMTMMKKVVVDRKSGSP